MNINITPKTINIRNDDSALYMVNDATVRFFGDYNEIRDFVKIKD